MRQPIPSKPRPLGTRQSAFYREGRGPESAPLSAWPQVVNEPEKKFEVVFVSSDNDEAARLVPYSLKP